MYLLCIKTDQVVAELYLLNKHQVIAEEKWKAHKELSLTIFTRLENLLSKALTKRRDINGIICFEGPGSFTGLRIGLSIGNALAYILNVPIIASAGEDWIKAGVTRILAGENQKIITPFYGSEAHITAPKK